MSATRISAKVTVVLSVDITDVWGGDCPMSQVNKQARESAIGHIARLAKQDPCVQILEAPKVTAVITEECR